MVDSIVVDTSVVASWVFEDEQNDYADSVLDAVSSQGISLIVPDLFLWEITNVCVSGIRRNRFDLTKAQEILANTIGNLPLEIRREYSLAHLPSILSDSSTYGLSAYDGLYLVLARDLNIPLATLDAQLIEVAPKEGIAVYNP